MQKAVAWSGPTSSSDAGQRSVVVEHVADHLGLDAASTLPAFVSHSVLTNAGTDGL
nr:hypothetical protein OG999_20390 [Streptomyces sp. NBC_00886]